MDKLTVELQNGYFVELDNLTIDPFSDVRGLIALFYRNMWSMADLREKLKRYEDTEEQGLLLRLPCGIGSDVYLIPSKVNYELNILSLHPENNKIYHQKVAFITFTEKGWYMECDKDREYGTDRILSEKMYKETWFLSQEEAEAKLKGIREKIKKGYNRGMHHYYCPVCYEKGDLRNKYNVGLYCSGCGQKLDWGDEE